MNSISITYSGLQLGGVIITQDASVHIIIGGHFDSPSCTCPDGLGTSPRETPGSLVTVETSVVQLLPRGQRTTTNNRCMGRG
jgi:hypothetical protein